MSRLLILTCVFQIVAAITAVAVARGRKACTPIAVFLCAMVLANAMKMPIRLLVLVPAREAGSVPFVGWVRVAAHIESALFVAWMAGFAGLAIKVFMGRRPWPLAIAWCLAIALLAGVFPDARGDELRRIYIVFELSALMVSLGAMLQWVITRSEPPGLHHTVVALIVLVELAGLVVGPWPWGLFPSWNLAQVAYCVMYATVIMLQLIALWFIPPPNVEREVEGNGNG
jgi:hypothetical protein